MSIDGRPGRALLAKLRTVRKECEDFLELKRGETDETLKTIAAKDAGAIRKELAKITDMLCEKLDNENDSVDKVLEYHVPPEAFDGRLSSNYRLLAPVRWYLEEVVPCTRIYNDGTEKVFPPEEELVFGRPSALIKLTGWQIKALYDNLVTAPNLLADPNHDLAVQMSKLLERAAQSEEDDESQEDYFKTLLGKCLAMIAEPPGETFAPDPPTVPNYGVVKPCNPQTAWQKIQEAKERVRKGEPVDLKMLEKHYPGIIQEIRTLASAMEAKAPGDDLRAFDVSSWTRYQRIALCRHLHEYPYLVPGLIIFTTAQFQNFLQANQTLTLPVYPNKLFYGKKLTKVAKYHLQKYIIEKEMEIEFDGKMAIAPPPEKRKRTEFEENLMQCL